jgi:hypothetical protein
MRIQKNYFAKRLMAVWAFACAVAVSPASAGTYDLQLNFSASQNPNGAWCFGWEPYAIVGGQYQPNGGFTPYNTVVNAKWYDSAHHSGDLTPQVWENTLGSVLYGVLPGQVSLHPGWDGSFSVVRWTAPDAGPIGVSGAFSAGDTGAMSYYVFDNGALLYEWLNDPSGESFAFNTTVAAGDTLDFAVGYNTRTGYYSGSTPLEVTIVTPEPSNLLLLPALLCAMAAARTKIAARRRSFQ